ncbi:MAG TPA: ScpA family protein [Roseiflexaceae bacterium]|nr:ScpA family protein [Roseiflexaceae bacterium]
MFFRENLDYTITLPVFEGPLDLLLRLIEREELDITTVALAQVADQYLAHVRAMPSPDPAALSAFLLIAARLLVIKSRALLPRPPSAATDEALSEGQDLVRQLQEYQRFKQAAALLRAWEAQGRRAYTRAAPPPLPAAPRSTPIDATLADMIAAVQRRMQLRLPLETPAAPLPVPKTITVGEMAARIQERLRAHEWFSFEDLLSTAVTREELVVALWAVLELLKRRAIVVEQSELFGPIMVGRGPELSAETPR